MSKKKVILTTIALLFVMIAAVSVVSYSIATLGHGDSEKGDIAEVTMDNYGAADTDYVTHIDLIIQNAIDNGETFNVLEILPIGTAGADATALKSYVTSEGFSKYVLSANKSTETRDMPTGHVTYNLLSVGSATALTEVCTTTVDADGNSQDVTVQNLIDSADLIYVSSPTYGAYNTNNISEDVFNHLRLYALSLYKPIIMDYVTPGSGTAVPNSIGAVVNEISKNYVKFRTYAWNDDATVKEFFTAQKSYYLPFNANTKTASGNILVLTTSDTATADSMAAKMINAGSAAVIADAYYGTEKKKPKSLNYTFKNVSTTTLTVDDFETTGGYDFILIEETTKDIVISEDVAKKIRSLSESSKYIIFDEDMDTSGNASVGEATNNYIKLMKLLINDKGVELFDNVLKISYGFFESLVTAGADGVDGAKQVADLIDAAVYRDSDQTGAGGKKYRVLEIQPCYPIDLDLAKTKAATGNYSAFGISGGYYTEPDQMVYGKTKDEIEEGTEYYAFEMSRAKVAYATGIPYDQIQVDQMSTNELISSKEVLAETYDMIYIGGDASAYVPEVSINYQGTQGTYQQDQRERLKNTFTIFNMYTHTGQFVDYKLPYHHIGDMNNDTNSVAYSGNDLTTIKRDELLAYVESGLPIIVDKVVTTAFENSYKYDPDNEDATTKSRVRQLALNDIDPDCNMYQFLVEAYKASLDPTVTNVGWGMIDSTRDTSDGAVEGMSVSEQYIENIDQAYGKTIGANVTVYNKDVTAKIKALYDAGAKRPKLTVTEYPKQYVAGDTNSTNVGASFTFKAKVDKSSMSTEEETYTISLYVDKNGDGFYNDGSAENIATELIDSQTCAADTEVEFVYELEPGYIGLVNWKIKVTNEAGDICDVRTGNAYVKYTDNTKKIVRVLQIMPVAKDQDSMANYITEIRDKHSLYFCTECQQAGKIIKNNVVSSANDPQRINLESYKNYETVFSGNNEVRVGKHEHDFGVVIYDSTTQLDDWESNLADQLTHGADGTLATGDFEIELDIFTVDDFEEWCKTAAELTEDNILTATVGAEKAFEEYEKALTHPDYIKACADVEDELFKAVSEMRTSGKYYGKNKEIILKGIGTKDKPGQWITDQEYYKFWEYFNDKGPEGNADNLTNFANLRTDYHTYVDLKNNIITLNEKYKSNLRQSGDEEEWLLNTYNAVVLGLADEFGNKHMSIEACEQLATYTKNGGIIINSHDTLTAKAETKAAHQMSDMLRATFGLDRFHVTGAVEDNGDIVAPYSYPTGSSYRRFVTTDSEKYFYTERIKLKEGMGYADSITAGLNGLWAPSYLKITNPVGITDLFAAYMCTNNSISPFRYAMMHPESYDHDGNVEGWSYEAKYGTRRAERVNEAGVTMFPFSISDELLISPTHGQTFALDLEDPTVAVWFTLAPTQINKSIGVDAGFARYVSSFYAASPKDGMNNYFLYSKENVYYTGAGHELITGRLKDNNDERKLFINTILNAITKGSSNPQLKLYNVCDENLEENADVTEHDNCDCNYVNPMKDKENAELAKQAHTLFFDKTAEKEPNVTHYQYNIFDSDMESYPEFDFKAIAGSSEITDIQVFYDLNYGTNTGMDKSNAYSIDDQHVMVVSYDANDNMDKKRVRLREETFEEKLQLQKRYFANYNDYTYLVIRVKDKRNNWQTARIKINVLPYLFDLTDANDGSSYQKLVADDMIQDMIDKKKYRI